MDLPEAHDIHHATAVSLAGNAALITGQAGSGKSSLALQLLALGADLIADDRCALWVRGEKLWVGKPPSLPALIEARGVGLIATQLAPPAPVGLRIDLDAQEDMRLPEERVHVLAGRPVKTLRWVDAPYFPAAIFMYLKALAT